MLWKLAQVALHLLTDIKIIETVEFMIYKLRIVTLLMFVSSTAIGQTTIDWGPDVVITQESFQGVPPQMEEDEIQRCFLAGTFDFNYHMSTLQFAFTKDFNKYVRAYYNPQDSWLERGELDTQLILQCNLDFDVYELFARRLRKRLYEAKRTGSKSNFYIKIFNDLNGEYVRYVSQYQSHIASSNDPMELIQEYQNEVAAEIESLNDYCRTCKIKKKRKGK